MSAKDAIKKGIIAKSHYIMINAPTPLKWLKSLKSWHKIYKKGIVKNFTRNEKIVEIAEHMYLQKRNVLIFIHEHEHTDILKEMFTERGIHINSPEVINGKMSKQEKREVIKKVSEESENGIITIGSSAVGMGTNLKYVDVVILAAGWGASTVLLQRIGRGARKFKDDFYIFDFKDWFHQTLSKHSWKREKAYEKTYETYVTHSNGSWSDIISKM